MDIRPGDILNVVVRGRGGAGGNHVAEVLTVVANSEGGLDLTVRVAAKRHDLSLNVMRRGGPHERDDDDETRPEAEPAPEPAPEPEPEPAPEAEAE